MTMSQKKKGFYLDDEDPETSMYFNGQTQPTSFFRDRDMLNAGSPSQAFNNSSVYSQQSGLSRVYNGNNFQRSTPTSSIGQTSLLQPQSPNSRNVLRGFHTLNQPFQTLQQQTFQKRYTNMPSFSSSSFGQPQQFGFQQSSRSTSNNTDMQQASQQMSIDLSASEFPSLTNRTISAPSMAPGIRNYVGMVGVSTKSIDTGGTEFSMQQEDFPALPGSQTTTNGTDSSKMGKDAVRSDQKPKTGVQSLPDGSVTNIPNGMVTDQFGMVGLLTFIRAAETDANLVALAPGVDLTSLGLNLNSPETLYSTFQAPWAESPCRPQDIDYHVPAEYLTNIFIREKLAAIKLNKYGEDMLFYLFYMNPGDVLQLAAASELYSRDWRYHKDEQVWITRAAGMEPLIKTNTYERGTYYVFDPQNWRKMLKEFHLEYDKLEERPQNLSSQHAGSSSQSVITH